MKFDSMLFDRDSSKNMKNEGNKRWHGFGINDTVRVKGVSEKEFELEKFLSGERALLLRKMPDGTLGSYPYIYPLKSLELISMGDRKDKNPTFDKKLPFEGKGVSLNKNSFLIEMSLSPFKSKVFAFLTAPWQEDIEIEIVTELMKHGKKFIAMPDDKLKEFMKKADEKLMTGANLVRMSDAFIYAMDDIVDFPLSNPK